MDHNATHPPTWLDRQTFWSGVFIAIAFLAGVGCGARIAVHGIRWAIQHQTKAAVTAVDEVASTAEGEAVGKIDLLSSDSLTLLLADQSQVMLAITDQTTVFEYAGEPTPLLPGEERPQTNLTLADLQPNDMVVVRYGSADKVQYALSIQKIH